MIPKHAIPARDPNTPTTVWWVVIWPDHRVEVIWGSDDLEATLAQVTHVHGKIRPTGPLATFSDALAKAQAIARLYEQYGSSIPQDRVEEVTR
jgi:hypothetical protein